MQNRAAAPALDYDQLRSVTMDDEELMREIVSALIDDAEVQLEHLWVAEKNADAAECARLAHFVKGACANVGAVAMASVLRSIEEQAAEGDWGACRRTRNSLETEFQRLRQEAAVFLMETEAA